MITCAEIKRLSPQKGDILVLRLEHGAAPEAIARLGYELREAGIESPFIIIEDDSDIYMLNEKMMRGFGWVRSHGGY